MQALIIAAGKGSRLQPTSHGEPKPLLPVLGLSLIERVILTAKRGGISEFVVVVGYRGNEIKEKLGNGSRYGVKISYVQNPSWERGNGVSVLKARVLLPERFLLLMGDHLFDPETVVSLLRMDLEDDECAMVVDRKPKDHLDIIEATRVKTEGGRVANIGKDMADYDAVDCGIFLLSPCIFDALEKSIAKGDESLSGGVRILAREGRVKSFHLNGCFWIDIDTPENYRQAEHLLFSQLIKPTDGPVSRLFNRPLSLRITKLLVKTSLTPNTISFVGFLLCVLASFFFALGSYLYLVVGAFLTQFASIVDGCDGEVARLKFQQSQYGAWMDSVLDRYADALLLLGIMYGWWSLHQSMGFWMVGTVALIGSFLNSYTATRYDLLFSKKGRRAKWRLGRDVRLLLIAVGALSNQLYWALLILAVATNAESVRRVIVLHNKPLPGNSAP